MSTMKTLRTTAGDVLRKALKLGAGEVRVVAHQSRDCSVVYRERRADKVQEASRRGIALDLYIDGRYTHCTTCDLRTEALDRFLQTSVAMCRAMESDPDRRLPDPGLYVDRRDVDLELFDPSIDDRTPQARHELAAAIEDATLTVGGERVLSVESGCADSREEAFQIQSNGFQGERRSTRFGVFADVTLRDQGDRRPAGWEHSTTRFQADSMSPAVVADRAVGSAVAKLGARKLPSERMVMILENRTVGGLLRQLLRAASAQQLHQKASFLDGAVGQSLGSPVLHLTDSPFIPRGLGSRLFDAEGVVARELPVFDQGVLREYYVDTYYGRKLDMPVTTADASNLVLRPGEKGLDALIADVPRGILVRGFIGGNSNTTTGDFSLGVYGSLIQDGVPTSAVAEMNIAGNHKELWRKLIAAGSDSYLYSSVRVPSLVFQDVQFSGA